MFGEIFTFVRITTKNWDFTRYVKEIKHQKYISDFKNIEFNPTHQYFFLIMYDFIHPKIKMRVLQLSPSWDFLLTCLGMSYVLWNPFLFTVFNVKFQLAAREFIKEEVILINSHGQGHSNKGQF